MFKIDISYIINWLHIDWLIYSFVISMILYFYIKFTNLELFNFVFNIEDFGNLSPYLQIFTCIGGIYALLTFFAYIRHLLFEAKLKKYRRNDKSTWKSR